MMPTTPRGIMLWGSRWTPLRLGASLLAWWSADRVDLMTLSGSQVVTWLDIVAGYAVTQGVSGSRPTYSATSFNGSPSVTFDGTDDELTLGSVPGTFPTGGTAGEIWALVDQLNLGTDATNRGISGYGGDTNATQRRLLRETLSNNNRAACMVGNGASTATADVLTVDFSGRHVVRAVVGASSTVVTIDGTSGSGASVTPSTGTSRVRLGAVPNTVAGAFFNGRIRDAIFTNALSADQAALLQTYLLNRRNP